MTGEQLININMAESKVAKAPATMRTVLGSCVGVFLYDPSAKIGGLLHIMLPEHPEDNNDYNKAKFASSGIPLLIDQMLQAGAQKRNFICKICGGSKMFSGFSSNTNIDIGNRNQLAAIKILKDLGIKISASDLGGTTGRKIMVDLSSGSIHVFHFNVGEKVI